MIVMFVAENYAIANNPSLSECKLGDLFFLLSFSFFTTTVLKAPLVFLGLFFGSLMLWLISLMVVIVDGIKDTVLH
jgi:hypothetical protein